jgi:hypothetical protein
MSLIAICIFLGDRLSLPTICIWKMFAHIPCPGCGMSRAVHALLHGDVSGTFASNILSIPLVVAVFVIFVCSAIEVIIQKSLLQQWKAVLPTKICYFVMGLLAIASWTYNILYSI